MGRIKPLDLVLLFVLGPVWIFSTALSMDRYLSDHPPAYIPVYFEIGRAPTEAPTVAGFSPGAAAFSNFDLQRGDRLVRVGGIATAGQDFVGLFSLIYGGADSLGKVPLRIRRDSAEFDASIQLTYIKQNYFGVLLGLVAGLVLLRGPGTRTSRAFAVGALVFALLRNDAFGSPVRWQILFGYGQMFAASAMAGPLLLRAAMTFPASAAPQSRWAYAIPWIFVLQPLVLSSYIFGWPIAPPLGLQLYLAFVVVLYATFIVIPTVNYWRADSRGRRQLRWIMYGLLVGVLPMAAAAALTLVAPSLYPYATGVFWLGGLLPIFILVALLWDHIFDIDRLITGTMVYGLLAALFLGLVFGVGLPVSQWLGAKLGVHPGAFIGIFIVGFALPVPLVIREGQPWLQKYIFREQAATERRLRMLRFEEDWTKGPGALLKQVGDRLLEVIPLENLAVYAPAGGPYVPVFSMGLLPPPAVGDGSALEELLLQAGVPIPARVWKRWSRTGRLGRGRYRGVGALGGRSIGSDRTWRRPTRGISLPWHKIFRRRLYTHRVGSTRRSSRSSRSRARKSGCRGSSAR